MIQPFKFLSREIRGMHQAAYVLAAFSLGSQVLALIRQRLFASHFGAGHTLDIYNAAFQVPDFLFSTVASLFSLYALLPILTALEEEKEGLMIVFLRNILSLFFVVMSFIAMILYIIAPVILPYIAPGIVHDPQSFNNLLTLMRILLLQPILLGAANTIASLTQLRHRFVLYSVSPLLYNIGIIFGILVLYPRFGIAGLGWGVVLGAFMHLIIQLPYFVFEKVDVEMNIAQTLKYVYKVLSLSIPRTLALASTQVSLIIIIAIASFLSTGSITILSFALTLQAVPLTIIGVSYSVAAFPTLSRLYAQGKRSELVAYIEAAMRHIIFWSIPATIFMIVLRAQIVRIIFGAGYFDWVATRLTAAALALLVTSLLAQSLILLMSRTYYATGNTRKPLYFGIADISVSVTSSLILVIFFEHNAFFREFVESLLRVDDIAGASVLMLAFGYALGSIVECLIGYYYFVRDFGIESAHLHRLLFESFGSSLIGGAIAYGSLSVISFNLGTHTTIAIMLEGGTAGLTGILVTVILLWLLKNRELSEAMIAITRRFIDVPRVAVEPSDVS